MLTWKKSLTPVFNTGMSNIASFSNNILNISLRQSPKRFFNSSTICRGMEEFLPHPLPQDTQYQSAGRAWTAAELRLKSFNDLHCLWFMCIKERNMLLTERLYYKQIGQSQPDPHRLKKIKATMARIRAVLGERERATEAMERDKKRSEKLESILAAGGQEAYNMEIKKQQVAQDLLVQEKNRLDEELLALAATTGKRGKGKGVYKNKNGEVMVTYKRYGRTHKVPIEQRPAFLTTAEKKRFRNKKTFFMRMQEQRKDFALAQTRAGVETPLFAFEKLRNSNNNEQQLA